MYEIPLEPGEPNQRLTVAIGDQQYILRTHWNERAEAHYMDVLEVDTTPIVEGLKLVLGVVIGRGVVHPLFSGNGFMLYDSSGSTPAREAGIDDLGSRVIVFYIDSADQMLLRAQPLETS